jgi:hypothetical protein
MTEPSRGDVPGAVVYRADLQNRCGDRYHLELPFAQFQRAGGASALVARLRELEVGPRMRRRPSGYTITWGNCGRCERKANRRPRRASRSSAPGRSYQLRQPPLQRKPG